jgi:DNA-binding GntR family transcriptional regulator
MESFKKHTNLSDDVYEYIKDMIFRGEITPGQRLLYDELGKKMGISVTPWRESMLKLEKEELVVSYPRGGTFVRKPEVKEIRDIYEIREALEGIAAREAALTAGAEDLQELAAILDTFKEAVAAGDVKECIEADFRFHFFLIELGKNEKLKKIVNSYNLQIISIIETGPQYQENAKHYLKEHISILEALQEKDAASAEELIKKHIRDGMEILLSSIETE